MNQEILSLIEDLWLKASDTLPKGQAEKIMDLCVEAKRIVEESDQ